MLLCVKSVSNQHICNQHIFLNLKGLLVHGPDRVTVHPPQDSLRPSFYCSLDLPGYQKSMPSKKSWDGLPVLGHFENGPKQVVQPNFFLMASTFDIRGGPMNNKNLVSDCPGGGAR